MTLLGGDKPPVVATDALIPRRHYVQKRSSLAAGKSNDKRIKLRDGGMSETH